MKRALQRVGGTVVGGMAAALIARAAHSPLVLAPILCGPFTETALHGREPERQRAVAMFFDALREITAKRNDLFFILGLDVAYNQGNNQNGG